MTDTRSWRHLYGRARWQRMRAHQLDEHPLCAFCIEQEIVTPATVVDHVVPHKGDETLFFDPDNLQSLCAPCHDGVKQRIELGQTIVRFGSDGWPLD